MCILLCLLFTLVEWLSLFKEDECFNYWIIDSPPLSQLSWWTIISNNWYQSIRSLKKKFNKFGRSMLNMFKKDSLNFDGRNYDSWKENMKTHLLCMGLGYWILTKSAKTIIAKKDLKTCTKEERET